MLKAEFIVNAENQLIKITHKCFGTKPIIMHIKTPNNRALNTYKIKNYFSLCLRYKRHFDKQIIRHKSQYNKQVFYAF